jgi:lipoate-protein ligase A
MILQSNNLNAFYNLAVEEYLLSMDLERYPILFLWQSENAVLVGRNQNPWRECRLAILRRNSGVLARRLSGGGAVYHDRGNLNCTLVVPRDTYDEQHVYQLLIDSLADLGVQAQLTNRNTLTVDGRKMSGNAFCLRSDRALHHATLLVTADLDRLSAVLSPVDERIHSRAVPSEPASVMNLSEVAADLTVARLKKVIAERFAGGQAESIPVSDLDQATILELREKYESWKWSFGRTPAFDIELNGGFDWGRLDLKIHVEDGQIHDVFVLKPSTLDNKPAGALPSSLAGLRFCSGEMAAALRTSAFPEFEDIAVWLESNGF